MNKWLNELEFWLELSYADNLKIAYLIPLATATILWIFTSPKLSGPSSHQNTQFIQNPALFWGIFMPVLYLYF